MKTFEKAHLNTIIAALRLYQSEGYGEPSQRPGWLHDIATDNDNDTSLDSAGIDELIEDLTSSELLPVEPLPSSPSLTDALTLIWAKLNAYQEELIPFDRYENMAQSCRADDSMYATYRATADEYRSEWDDVCHHMALIHEALGISQEDC